MPSPPSSISVSSQQLGERFANERGSRCRNCLSTLMTEMLLLVLRLSISIGNWGSRCHCCPSPPTVAVAAFIQLRQQLGCNLFPLTAGWAVTTLARLHQQLGEGVLPLLPLSADYWVSRCRRCPSLPTTGGGSVV